MLVRAVPNLTLFKINLTANCSKDLNLFKWNIYFVRVKFTLDFKINIQAFLCLKSGENFALSKYIFHLKRFNYFKTVCRFFNSEWSIDFFYQFVKCVYELLQDISYKKTDLITLLNINSILKREIKSEVCRYGKESTLLNLLEAE